MWILDVNRLFTLSLDFFLNPGQEMLLPVSSSVFLQQKRGNPCPKTNGPSGNRTRVLGFEAQEDILYPMDPSLLLYIKRY